MTPRTAAASSSTSNARKALATVGPVFGPMMGAWQRMADQYSDDELRLIVEFYGQMEDVIRDHLQRLRSPGTG